MQDDPGRIDDRPQGGRGPSDEIGLGLSQDRVQIGQPRFRSNFEACPGILQGLAQGIQGQWTAKLMNEAVCIFQKLFYRWKVTKAGHRW